MDMDLDMHDDHYDWAHDAFVKLNATDMDTADLDMDASLSTWPPFATKPTAVSKPPARAAIERHGQITPPEDSLSPPTTPMSRPAHMLLPAERPMEQPLPTDRAPRHRRTVATKPASANPPPSHDPRTLDNATTALHPQPPKRKRGRPKSQSQPLPTDAYNPDGFPFPISTARQSHLEKNRVAAHKCRQRRKEYIDSLEARGREASTKNKQLKENVAILRDEILGLKNEVLRHAGCNFWAVDEYLARCAGDLLGVAGPPPTYSRNSLSFSPLSSSGHDFAVKERSMSIHSLPSRDISNSPDDFDDYFIDNTDKDIENSNA